MTANENIDIDEELRNSIREQVLAAEQQQLHLDRPHNIIPEIVDIIESEVEEVDDVPIGTGGES
mgnify:CR=1 FL=1